MKKLVSRLVIPLFALTIVLVGGLIFRDFLFGDRLLLYKDIGSDSLIDYYPWFVHFSDYLRSQGIPSWSFSVGMGQDIFYLAGYLILQPIVWLPRELIAHALVYQHLVKVLIAGLLFFRFLQLRGLKLPALVVRRVTPFLLRLHVHGQLLVYHGGRGCLFCRASVRRPGSAKIGCWYPL